MTSYTDVRIQEDVTRELAGDTRVECTEVGVAVREQVVTLTGTVTSWAKKLAAADAAHRVDGVLDVANDLVVKPPYTAAVGDDDIAAAVRHALIWDVFVPADRIESTVSNGLVRLGGVVDYASEREDAARAIGNLAGVCAIDNLITVKHASTSESTVRSAIRGALERLADREASRIALVVDQDCVTLQGEVASVREHHAVVGAVRGTRGVKLVVDQLRVALPPL